nr:MAG TPA: hypothetical protein [Caudoviricetes sp.]
MGYYGNANFSDGKILSAHILGGSIYQGYVTFNNEGQIYVWAASGDAYIIRILYQ